MRAVVIRKGATAPELMEVPDPDPAPGEALVRTLRVGVDGTDYEVIKGAHGGFPEGDDYLVMGHEAVGVVEDPNGTALEAGDVVVPTVRRPPASGTNEYFERDEAHMAPADMTIERGIAGGHGFMSEYFTAKPEDLVPLPEELAPLGFLVEPISIAEKAIEFAAATRAPFDWSPESAVVLGNGSLGLLTLAMLDGFDRTYCLGRRDRPDPTIDIMERLGATYIDSRETPVADIPRAYEGMDFVFEATGYAPHAIDGISALAPNGVCALLGVPEPWTFEIDGGSLHKDIVMNNKAVVGSVNSGREHFLAAIDTLAGYDDWFTDALVTKVVGLDDFAAAFDDGKGVIKTAVEFGRR